MKELAQTHSLIVEFGSGGSTQILGHYSQGHVTSYETNEYWISKTKKHLVSLNIENVYIKHFNSINDLSIPEHDLLFIDGFREMRISFANKALETNKGIIAFHDTRKRMYTEKIVPFVHLYWNKIRRIDVNYRDSNITLLHMREVPLAYEDWNKVEGRTRQQIGIA
ncbi:MAG TPA: hypothetical protein VD907_06610 [Verrucomicrobiae bacterium]|nr:hypothetical protein [Verrucomicrobiae bacterium]